MNSLELFVTTKKCNQKDVAKLYAQQISELPTVSEQWSNINRAIITKWSKKGLERIKKMAWAISASASGNGEGAIFTTKDDDTYSPAPQEGEMK